MAVNYNDLDINPRIIAAVRRAGFLNCERLLCIPSNEMERRTGLSPIDVEHLISAVAEASIPSHDSVYELQENQSDKLIIKYIKTGCENLDKFLGGGIPIRGVTEISGASGSGKTQLGLQMALRVQLPQTKGGLGKGVAYICTECQFPTSRLQQLISHMTDHPAPGIKSFTDSILVHHLADMDSLVDCVRYQLPHLISRHKLGLVIIDSVAAVFRVEENEDFDKSKLLQSLGYQLNRLAHRSNVAIIAINQVTAAMKSNNIYGSDGSVLPALGLAWANLVTSRLMLSKTLHCVNSESLIIHKNNSTSPILNNDVTTNLRKDGHSNNSNIYTANEYRVRELEVIFCPWLAKGKCSFVVTEAGIEDISLGHVNVHFTPFC